MEAQVSQFQLPTLSLVYVRERKIDLSERMPCGRCPEERDDSEKIQDADLRRIWRALFEIGQSRVHFLRHLDYLSCVRCREIALNILTLMDIYSRIVSDAENYRLEKARLTATIQGMLENLNPEENREKASK